MKNERNILEEAIIKLREYSGLSIKTGKGKSEGDVYITISERTFVVEVKTAISAGNKAL